MEIAWSALGQTGSLLAVYGQRSGHNIYLGEGGRARREQAQPFRNIQMELKIRRVDRYG
jgi:hypothetical protein